MAEKMTKVRYIAERAYTDPEYAKNLLEEPASAFRAGGIDIPDEEDARFKKFFDEIAPVEVKDIASGKRKPLVGAAVAEALTSAGCDWCKVGCYSIAITLIGIGAAGIALLTPGSAVVVALAAFAGVAAETALAFIVGLIAVLSSGPSVVAGEICKWMGAC